MQKIIGIGNSLVDILTKVEEDAILDNMELPKGSMQLIDGNRLTAIQRHMNTLEHSNASGGSASNTIKSLAQLGADTAFIGKVANDETGKFFCSEMNKAGVNMSIMRQKESNISSGTAYTFVSKDGQRTFATYLGISAELSAEDITDDIFDRYQILYVEGYLIVNHTLMERIMSLAKNKGLTVCLDLASYNIVEAERDFFNTILKQYVDIVFANEEEATAFTGKKPEEATLDLAELTSIAVVKMGKDGACACENGKIEKVKAQPCKQIIDTTGAGDYFAAGFLYAYINGWSQKRRLETGSITAAAVIQVMGATLPPDQWTQIKTIIG